MNRSLIDPILARLKIALDEIYGPKLERAVLYGSRARGDGRSDSDYDVAIFVKNLGDFGDEAARLAEIETDFLFATGAVISVLPLRSGSYGERTALMGEIRRDGRDL